MRSQRRWQDESRRRCRRDERGEQPPVMAPLGGFQSALNGMAGGSVVAVHCIAGGQSLSMTLVRIAAEAVACGRLGGADAGQKSQRGCQKGKHHHDGLSAPHGHKATTTLLRHDADPYRLGSTPRCSPPSSSVRPRRAFVLVRLPRG